MNVLLNTIAPMLEMCWTASTGTYFIFRWTIRVTTTESIYIIYIIIIIIINIIYIMCEFRCAYTSGSAKYVKDQLHSSELKSANRWD